jgi:putative transposase
MSEVDSIALQQSRINLQDAFKNFFASISGKRKGPKINPPVFKSKRNGHQSYKSVNVSDNIKIDFDTRHIKLPKVGWVKFRDPRIFSQNIRSVTVSRDPSYRFYISILIDKTIPKNKVIPKKFLGIDMSLQHLVVDHMGNKTDYPRYFRTYEKKLVWEQRKLSRKQVGSKTQKASKRYLSQKIATAKVHAKIADSRNDFLQKLSTQITNESDVICIETLNMKAMAQSLKLGKSVNDIGWGMFARMLEYKALWHGKYVIKVPKNFPSSKLCSVCEYKNSGLTLSDRTWLCPSCGTHHDRDENAAINVRNEGRRIFDTYGTVGTTGTGLPIGKAYTHGDCVRPMHHNDLALSDSLSCVGNGR